MSDARASQHRVDRLIRELIHTGRPATATEVAQIIDRMATAPFDQRQVPVPTRMRGLQYRQTTLGAQADALTYHLIKRVVGERQWAEGTTAAEYVADLRRAVRASGTRLAVYERRGGHVVVTLTATYLAAPAARRTRDSLADLLIVYSADSGIIRSGYQLSNLQHTGVPAEARWLR